MDNKRCRTRRVAEVGKVEKEKKKKWPSLQKKRNFGVETKLAGYALSAICPVYLLRSHLLLPTIINLKHLALLHTTRIRFSKKPIDPILYREITADHAN